MEYWHIKAELAFCNLEGIISTVEKLISDIVTSCEKECNELMAIFGTVICVAGKKIPFPRITYREAVMKLNELGMPFEFGKSLGSAEEELLSKQFDSPFWITGNHRNCEPFPYVIDPNDPEVTITADLIATEGYGELLGVAEKITNISELEERMKEKGKYKDERYDWFCELRDYGCVAHCGFGMGLERFIRWVVRVPHVRDVMPFPRIFNRKIYP